MELLDDNEQYILDDTEQCILEVFSCIDIINVIGSFLSIRDFVTLIKTLEIDDYDYTVFKDKWISDGTERIKQKLEHIGWTESIFDTLLDSGSLVAGSFPLQCLLNEYWDQSDIDIFSKYCKRYSNTSFFEVCMFSKKIEILKYFGFDPSFKRYCLECDYTLIDRITGMFSCQHMNNPYFNDLDENKYISYLKEQGHSPIQIIYNVSETFCDIYDIRYGKRISQKNMENVNRRCREIVETLKVNFPMSLLESDNSYQICSNSIKRYIFTNNDYDYDTLMNLRRTGGLHVSYPEGQYIIKTTNFLMGGIKHQNIIVFPNGLKDGSQYNISDPFELINEFDFDFCKVYYDGYKLHVKNWDSIINFTSKINKGFGTNISRKEKYERRGFTIIDDENEP